MCVCVCVCVCVYIYIWVCVCVTWTCWNSWTMLVLFSLMEGDGEIGGLDLIWALNWKTPRNESQLLSTSGQITGLAVHLMHLIGLYLLWKAGGGHHVPLSNTLHPSTLCSSLFSNSVLCVCDGWTCTVSMVCFWSESCHGLFFLAVYLCFHRNSLFSLSLLSLP